MARTSTRPEHDPDAWRGDTVFGMRVDGCGRTGRSLVLDIDHAAGGVLDGGAVEMRRSPTDLVFDDVRDLEMSLQSPGGETRAQVIERIECQPPADGFGGHSRWRIVLRHPAGDTISFRARDLSLVRRQSRPASSG